MLKYGADYVFSEIILISKLKKEIKNNKFKYFEKDIEKTIFQVGVSSPGEVDIALEKLSFAKEININMDCPRSNMKDVCGGLLDNEELMDSLTLYFAKECKKRGIIPSVKIRLGPSPSNIRITQYLDIFEKNKIKKVYIHARTLRYPYVNPAIHEPLFSLKEYKLKIIVNGDIDNYLSYKKFSDHLPYDIMIGRAALINPFIFQQIKNKENPAPGPFNPILKDPGIIRKDRKATLSKEKKEFIDEYKKLADSEGISPANLKYLTKGVSKK